MPIDRPNPINPRPLKPTLASNRTAKTPLTPRLAVAPTAASAGSSQSTRTVRSSNATTPRANTTVREDATPVKAFLNSNVTPRSSSRKSRVGVESESSTPSATPTSTPTSSRPTSTIDFPQRTPRLPLSNSYNHAQFDTGAAKDVSALFFHANDARPHEPAPTQKKAPVFFYANGKQDDTLRKLEASSPPLSSVGKLQQEGKFFHADSLSEIRDSPPIVTPPPELLSRLNGVHNGLSPRPDSPTKDWHSSYRKGTSQVMRPTLITRNSALSNLSGPDTPDVPDRARRRSSAASSIMRLGHAKSASLSSIDSIAELNKARSIDLAAPTPSPLHTEHRIVSNSSLPDSVASAPSPQTTSFSGFPSPGPTSPTRLAKSAIETMNDLAANARRERKVLDLEISNSSLLAINRSLEKEVRKQKAELRRFRRMSRAGRFSTDTVGSTLDTFSAIGVNHLGDLSDMSEREEIEEPEEEDLESSDSSFDESALSPTAQAERDEVHRLRDEKRLQLDLSKHRELLVDSQKMNQSLKRCLGWTEQLIKDGQKALEYQVRVSDIRLGGRVLVVEDDHETTHAEESRGLLSPWSPLHHAVDALDSPFFLPPNRVIDRDSGVDLEGLAPAAPEYIEDFAPLGSPFEERIKHLQASFDALEAS